MAIGGIGIGVLKRLARIRQVFGSDVYLNYTHAYVWGANQFGHLFIGVGLTVAFLWLTGHWAWALGLALGIYLIKEMIDALIALFLREPVFRLRVWEVLFDGIVDWSFVAIGAAVAIAAHILPQTHLAPNWQWGGAIIAVTIVFFLGMRMIYGPRKGSFDKAGLPYYTRLATFPDNFRHSDCIFAGAQAGGIAAVRARVEEFLAHGKGGPRQIVICGPDGSGRTTLACAIAGDATNSKQRVRYIDCVRVQEKRKERREIRSDDEKPWQLGEAEMIVIDSIIPEIISRVSPEKAAEDLRKLVFVSEEKTLFERPVLGPRQQLPAPDRWKPRMPRLIWVVEDTAAGAVLAKALETVFGGRGAPVLLLVLHDKLDERRARTNYRSPQIEDTPARQPAPVS